ncbi:MAG: SpoIVB peptidase [Defluviitaleaceae bacterium]|nr:SpoIVB peptidase [Defluviitaleaceae bacterium]
MRRNLKIIAILLFCVISGYAVGSFAYLLRFPQEIRLTEFTTHRLNVSLPLSATFHETAAVSKVNDTPLSESMNVRLGRPVTIQTDSYGTAEMTIGAFGVPFRRITLDVVPEVEVIPLGVAIGVRINTDGVMVLGTGSFQGVDGETHRPAHNVLRAGDLILETNGTAIKYKEDLSEYVAKSEGDVILLVRRDNEEIHVTITPQVAAADDTRRIGAWVRDSTKGIGTLTFYNPATSEFGALGHGILDVDTKMLLSVRSGTIMPSTVTSVQRGARGMPGELEGQVDTSTTLGTITTNCPNGIFGELEPQVSRQFQDLPRMPIAQRAQIQEGPATILTNVSGSQVKEYEIEIETIHQNPTDETKGMVIRITDPDLLEITGGIVQGMSGSPILQDGRIIGAITHVFVQDPTKGYGIFIESMLHHCPSTAAYFAVVAA